MCWISANKPEFKVAEKDITSYKIVYKAEKGKFRSMYFNKIYTPGKLESLKKDLLFERTLSYLIYEGFHSYEAKAEGVRKEPFHLSQSNVTFVRCTIPKGATYCVNEDGEIVSNKIIIDTDNVEQ